MQPLFCYPEKVFCKNKDWEKAYRRSVMPLDLTHHKYHPGSLGIQPSWRVGILRKTRLEPRDPL